MNTKNALQKSLVIVTIIGLFGGILGSFPAPADRAYAADVLLASVAITASPGSICTGQTTLLSWSSTDATSISIDQGIGSVLPYGDRNVSPTQTTTYTITGSNSTGGFATASVTVSVSGSCNTPTPTPPTTSLRCSPSSQSVVSGGYVSFSAFDASNFGQLTWTAVGGSPSSGFGSSFSTRFYTGSINETRVVSVTDGSQTAYCTVYVSNQYPTPTPYRYLECSPSYTTMDSGDRVRFEARGGDGNYYWSAPGGSPSYGDDDSFTTRFYNDTYGTYNYGNNTAYNDGNYYYDAYGNYVYNGNANYNYPQYSQNRYATVTSAGQSATCRVSVNGDDVNPSYGTVSVTHTVRNNSRGGTESSSVTAYNGDRLRFTTTIRAGSRRAEDLHIRDWLPQYVTYVWGSTRVDNRSVSDGIATGGNTDSLALGDLSANRTMTVTFEGTLNSAPASVLTNTVNVHARGSYDQTRTSRISVVGSYYPYPTPYPTYYPTPYPTYQPTPTYYPTPYVTPYANARIALRTLGRNVSRGQTGEFTSVQARGNDTLDKIIRIRSTNTSYLSNVYVTDLLPAGLSYIPGSTTVNGSPVADGITSSGINIGTVSPNAETAVKFSVRVDSAFVPTVGTVTIQNTAQVRADGLPTVSSQLPITLGQDLNLAAISSIKTGAADSVWLALAVALLASGAYVVYTRTGAFARRRAHAEISRLSGSSGLNFSK